VPAVSPSVPSSRSPPTDAFWTDVATLAFSTVSTTAAGGVSQAPTSRRFRSRRAGGQQIEAIERRTDSSSVRAA